MSVTSKTVTSKSRLHDYLVMLVTLVKYYKYDCFKRFYTETFSDQYVLVPGDCY